MYFLNSASLSGKACGSVRGFACRAGCVAAGNGTRGDVDGCIGSTRVCATGGLGAAKVFIAGNDAVTPRPMIKMTRTAERVSGFRLMLGSSMAANLLSSVDGRAMLSTADHARSVVFRL